ncbi:uncharacterized protein LOC126268168 isoform X1 [Schistocerca gregaria]|uniref:uncharacterized protein LOC126268168 isoform X1 n=1 Tax=Schistocerca gregaria TaxID=7010 RepID=UPI00211EB516|nr:uncharacterized protein LOC126268168 isoform X1 [Schistocerca gregaria]
MQPEVVVKKLSPDELRRHGYILKLCSNTSESQYEFIKENSAPESQKQLHENEVPHFPSWTEGSIVWGRTLNSPWWPAVVCTPAVMQESNIPGCAWLQWACESTFDVVCNVNVMNFKEEYSKCFNNKFNQKGYKKAVLSNIKAIARKSGIDVENWTRQRLMKWASNGFKHQVKDGVHSRCIYNTRSKKFYNCNDNKWTGDLKTDVENHKLFSSQTQKCQFDQEEK